MSSTSVNVLIVDDHPENLLALEAILSGLGQRVIQASSGEEALRCLLHEDFAVILLDVQMPGMDGLETAQLIRQRARSRHTPIIFLTAFSSNDQLMTKGYALGAVDYLLKPIDATILTSKVSVFVELFQKTAEVKRQAAELATVNAELRVSEERFRSLSTSSPVGVFMTDIAGHCTYTNPSCQAIAGFTLEESLEQGWLKAVHPDDRRQVVADWASTTRNASSYSGESRFLWADGTVRWVHIRSSPMRSDQGELLGHVGTVEDITERKQAEAAQAQFLREQIARQQAEAANRMKDEFLSTLSHELRTPLNSMLGWVRLLRTRNFDEATKERALEIIERNAKSQAQLIEDILDVSRIITGKIRLVKRPLNLNAILETVIDMSRPTLEAKSLHLVYEPETVGSVLGDGDRIQQICWNLLSNAIKFTPEGGKVTIQLATEHPESDALPLARIDIIDTGVGITPDFLPYVFERFRQADSTTTRPHGGLGLGLAIVSHLVQLHDGTIEVQSSGKDQGATFTVRFPITEAVAPPVLPESHLQDSAACLSCQTLLSGVKILVVDDEPDAREVVAVMLEEYGVEVTTAGSVAEAIALLPTCQPHLLLSDIGMPQEDGYSLVHRLRKFCSEADIQIPVVALTAYARDEERSRALEAGFQAHLSKPVQVNQLIQTVLDFVPRPAGETCHSCGVTAENRAE